MKKILSNMMRIYGLVVIMTMPIFASCSWVEPGTENDPGKAVGAPTESEAVDNSYQEGLEYPEEQEAQ
jgi:hypothetical protein